MLSGDEITEKYSRMVPMRELKITKEDWIELEFEKERRHSGITIEKTTLIFKAAIFKGLLTIRGVGSSK